MSCLLGLDLVKHHMLWWINILLVPAWILAQGQGNMALFHISSPVTWSLQTCWKNVHNSWHFVKELWSSFPIFLLPKPVWFWFVVNFKSENGKIILLTASFFYLPFYFGSCCLVNNSMNSWNVLWKYFFFCIITSLLIFSTCIHIHPLG